MTDLDDHAARALDVLRRAVAEALERKRRLGQYFVVWRNGRAVCIGPDAPVVCNSSGTGTARATGGETERGKTD